MTEANKTVEVSVAGGVRTLTLNRPPVNVMDLAMIQELGAAVAEGGSDPATRVNR